MAGKRTPTIILTGGSRGIGLACLKKLLKSSNLISISRSYPRELEDLVKSNPDRLKVLNGDVRDDNTNRSAVELALKSFGSLDGLILNSGTIKFEKLDSPKTLDSFKDVFDINFFSLVSILNAAIPHLRQSKGRVVFVSSGASIGGIGSWGSYNASKAAMNSLCRTLANEEPDITSIAVRPGVVDTEMQNELRTKAKEVMSKPNYDHFYKLYETSKLLPVEKPAEVISNLVLDHQSQKQLTGQFLSWDSEELKPFRS
ncbi:hypothetical protein BY996DRAFT_7468387 [Phakopsora pachyrhizi]|uniref:Ketoreductase domain-containing protein n=1 Tax=Phakopsora pachyrhizi TaxID=170000 RepID=A0AAV0B285_PHAPC|nr:hypothetical protein BY996DRAFT_7587145 [Phakopsora pachyrhizi]KAI8449583.1 hypothetical protein BY996DRAFT_7468387 [Phakopsora pachyrhizi]CAH7676384.1 hypothetical protein PPACK8108_LOCUS11502 [Phakopsora pachyrhizi]